MFCDFRWIQLFYDWLSQCFLELQLLIFRGSTCRITFDIISSTAYIVFKALFCGHSVGHLAELLHCLSISWLCLLHFRIVHAMVGDLNCLVTLNIVTLINMLWWNLVVLPRAFTDGGLSALKRRLLHVILLFPLLSQMIHLEKSLFLEVLYKTVDRINLPQLDFLNQLLFVEPWLLQIHITVFICLID